MNKSIIKKQNYNSQLNDELKQIIIKYQQRQYQNHISMAVISIHKVKPKPCSLLNMKNNLININISSFNSLTVS